MDELGGDKFSEINSDKLPTQIQWKLRRAKQHFQEFERAAAAYMNVGPSGPGQLMPAPESTSDKQTFIYATADPLPAYFGLIAGDYLQNLRSVLDYLVWQLILANGKIPHETNTAFPVCKSKKSFDAARVRRLMGVPDEAIDIIEALQPYPERDPGAARPQTIHILDELTNQNKHRQVLFATVATIIKPDVPVPFPHIEVEVLRHKDGHSIPGERILAYLAFQSVIVKGLEVTATLSALMNWMGFEILPQFERFF